MPRPNNGKAKLLRPDLIGPGFRCWNKKNRGRFGPGYFILRLSDQTVGLEVNLPLGTQIELAPGTISSGLKIAEIEITDFRNDVDARRHGDDGLRIG